MAQAIEVRDDELLGLVGKVDVPMFDLHNIEEGLKVSHVLYNGTPLTEEEVAASVHLYRLFLAKHKADGMPKEFSIPSRVVDRAWHTHMCETEQYANDCQQYFGQIFHHRSGLCDAHPDLKRRAV